MQCRQINTNGARYRRMNQEQTVEFWRWFAANSDRLARHLESKGDFTELDQRISALFDGSLSWEVGPGQRKPYALAISPSGRRTALGATRQIVSAARTLEQREFHAAKPPKAWSPHSVFEGAEGQERSVDATNWEYVLSQLPKGGFDITVRAPGLDDWPEQDKLWAAEIALDGMLGELTRLECIHGIEVVRNLDEGLQQKATPIGFIREHLGSLLELE